MADIGWQAIAAFAAWTALIYAMGRAAGRREGARGLSAPPPRRVTLAELPVDARKAIEADLANGDKIGAIRRLRSETGLGLKEARESVEAMARR